MNIMWKNLNFCCPSRHSFYFFFVIFCLQYWYNIHPWWWADTPAAALESPVAALGIICNDTFLLLDFPGLNQGTSAGRDSNPGLPYSSPTRAYSSPTRMRKNQLWICILSELFGSEIETCYTLCGRYTLCDGGPSLGAKLGLSDDFSQYFFLRTSSGNGSVDRGIRDLLESGL